MATKMIFLCSCGAVFDIGDSGDVENHLDARQDHVIHEATVHQSAQPDMAATDEAEAEDAAAPYLDL